MCRQLELEGLPRAPVKVATPQNVMWLRLHFAGQRLAYEQAHAAADDESVTADPIVFFKLAVSSPTSGSCACAVAAEPTTRGYLAGTRGRALHFLCNTPADLQAAQRRLALALVLAQIAAFLGRLLRRTSTSCCTERVPEHLAERVAGHMQDRARVTAAEDAAAAARRTTEDDSDDSSSYDQ